MSKPLLHTMAVNLTRIACCFVILAALNAVAAAQCCGVVVQPVCHTVFVPQEVTRYRIEYETVMEPEEVTTYRPVWETSTRERRYTVGRPATETS